MKHLQILFFIFIGTATNIFSMEQENHKSVIEIRKEKEKLLGEIFDANNYAFYKEDPNTDEYKEKRQDYIDLHIIEHQLNHLSQQNATTNFLEAFTNNNLPEMKKAANQYLNTRKTLQPRMSLPVVKELEGKEVIVHWEMDSTHRLWVEHQLRLFFINNKLNAPRHLLKSLIEEHVPSMEEVHKIEQDFSANPTNQKVFEYRKLLKEKNIYAAFIKVVGGKQAYKITRPDHQKFTESCYIQLVRESSYYNQKNLEQNEKKRKISDDLMDVEPSKHQKN